MNLYAAFLAGATRRWHANPFLSHTVDRTDGHSARVARIIDKLWPDASKALLCAALRHDDGESAIGDLIGPAKAGLSAAARAEIDKIESDRIFAIWGKAYYLTKLEARQLRFADVLDAMMWASFYAPATLHHEDWAATYVWLRNTAVDLGVFDEMSAALEAAKHQERMVF